MYNFEKELFNHEKIIYLGQSFPGKGGKNIGGALLIILFMLCIQGLMVWSLNGGIGDGEHGINLIYIILFLVTLLFDGIAVFILIYNTFSTWTQCI